MLKTNKSPGLDGIPSEFYHAFWEKINTIIVESFNESYEEGQLSDTQRTAVISLIFKKGDAQLLSNYRPISLTNCDYKILAFCLANRIQRVIKSVVNSSQVAYIKGRYIGNNIRLIEDIIDFYDYTNIGGVLMMLDFQKAFDSLEWNFLYHVLELFNFGESFINWMKTLYSNPITCIKNNGYLSPQIDIQRGIRQGCPVSALLFIIATEIMAIDIRQSKDLTGIQIPGNGLSLRILQYADDGVLFLNNELELEKAITIVNRFGQLAGTELNFSKCEGLWLGCFKDRQTNCTLCNIKWPVQPIRCLGIYVGNDQIQRQSLNWSEKVVKIKKLVQSWKRRNLTLFGKITIIKQLAMPTILFSASMLPVPEGIIKELNTVFYNFIWGKKDKIKRSVLINDIKCGGLNMVDVESLFLSVKAAWVVRLLHAKEDEVWTMVANHFLHYVPNDDAFLLRLHMTDANALRCMTKLPMFYQEVIMAFNKAKCLSLRDFCNNILDQPIWGNVFIKCNTANGKNVPLLYKSWIQCNLIKLKNLRFIDGKLDEHYIFDTVQNQTNIFAEINSVKKALKPYRTLIGSHEPDNDTHIILFPNQENQVENFQSTKSKFFYNCLVDFKSSEPVKQQQYWKDMLRMNDIDFQYVYETKVKCVKDKKLAEFNFKLLQNILPCNVNLVKWKKHESKLCDLCGIEEDIKHLLYTCDFAKGIWTEFTKVSGIDIELQDIVLGVRLDSTNTFIVSMFAYLIYKDWLIHSLNSSPRSRHASLMLMKSDLKYRSSIYSTIGLHSVSDMINVILSSL